MKKIFIFFLFFFLSCKKNKASKTNTVLDHISIYNGKYDISWEFTRKRELLTIEKINRKKIDGQILEIDMDYNQIWLNDNSSFNVKSLSMDLESIGEYGKKGDGPPEENGQLMFVDIIEKEKYYVYDFGKMFFKKMDLKNNLISYKKSRKVIYRGLHIHDDVFLVAWVDESNDNLFEIVLLDVMKDQVIQKVPFHELIGVQKEFLLDTVYDGEFLKNKQGEIFYFCWNTGLFMKFKDNFIKGISLDYLKRTIDKTPPSKGKQIDLGAGISSFIIYPEIEVSSSACANKDFLFLLSSISKGGGKEIDYYRIEDGKYMGSIKIFNLGDGQEAKLIAVDNNQLVVLYEDMDIILYEIKKNKRF